MSNLLPEAREEVLVQTLVSHEQTVLQIQYGVTRCHGETHHVLFILVLEVGEGRPPAETQATLSESL